MHSRACVCETVNACVCGCKSVRVSRWFASRDKYSGLYCTQTEYLDYQFWSYIHCLLIHWGKTVSAGMAESQTDPPGMRLRHRSQCLPSTF